MRTGTKKTGKNSKNNEEVKDGDKVHRPPKLNAVDLSEEQLRELLRGSNKLDDLNDIKEEENILESYKQLRNKMETDDSRFSNINPSKIITNNRRDQQIKNRQVKYDALCPNFSYYNPCPN